MRAVNLLPADARGRGGPSFKLPARRAPLLGAAAALAVLVLLSLAFISARSSVNENRAALELRRAELAAIPLPPPVSTASSGLADERTRRTAALAAALGGRVAWDRILRKVALVLPEDTWLSGLTGTAPAATPAEGAPTGVVLNGFTYSHAAVARLLSRLAVVPELADVTLQSSTLTDVEGRPAVQFGIAANIRPGGSG